MAEESSPLTFPLSPKERSTLFFLLGKWGGFCVGESSVKAMLSFSKEKTLAMACEESRFEPRLLGILIDFFSRHYASINPFSLAEKLTALPTPQTLGAVSEFAKRLNPEANLKDFFKIALRSVTPAPMQLYYNAQFRPHPEEIDREVLFSPWEFKKWGFLSSMDPYLKESRPKAKSHSFSRRDRSRILRHLLAERPRIKVKDYLEALQGTISRQQAYLDLQGFKGIRRSGQKKGRHYAKGA